MGRPRESSGLAGEAYVIVRERILRGELAIGQVISRRKLAAELGMSFLPVSEALLQLEHEGLLESSPRAGTRVRVPTRQDVRGHYVVREALEVQAAMLFCSGATPGERAELQKLAARVDALSVQAEVNRFVYLNLHEKLHRRIAECSRCGALCDAIRKTAALASTWLCATRKPASNVPPDPPPPKPPAPLPPGLAPPASPPPTVRRAATRTCSKCWWAPTPPPPLKPCASTSSPAANEPSSAWNPTFACVRSTPPPTREPPRTTSPSTPSLIPPTKPPTP